MTGVLGLLGSPPVARRDQIHFAARASCWRTATGRPSRTRDLTDNGASGPLELFLHKTLGYYTRDIGFVVPILKEILW